MAAFLPPQIRFPISSSSTAWHSGVFYFRSRQPPPAVCYRLSYDPQSEHIAEDTQTPSKLRTYEGPVLQDPSEIVAGVVLGELGLDLVVAPSTVAPGTLGLFVILSDDVESTTVPCMSLLSGYSREGKFLCKDEGDKTVGFALGGRNTAVFYERQLMSIIDALELAAKTVGNNGACGLAGHGLEQRDDDGVIEIRVDPDPEFARFFVPALLNRPDCDDDDNGSEDISVQNLGQFCNDLAWSYQDPPKSKQEYDAKSLEKNAVQLVWRLEFDEPTNCLVPTWPVSVLASDLTFNNRNEFMELGTKYGWQYWQATVDLNSLN